MSIIYICAFFLGAAFASFINATLYRLDKKYKYPEIFTKGSHCENCGHELSWTDLFPVLGYILNKGKCKYCGSKIDPYYPISEFILGVIFLGLALYFIPIYMFVIVLFLFVLSTYDFKEMGIPKNITHIFLGICFLIFILFTFNLENIILPVGIAVIFLLLNSIKKSFGTGDILVILGLGILLNRGQFLVFFWLSIVLALLYSVFIIVTKHTKLKNAKVPMVPFLSIAFVASIIYGTTIWEYILKLWGI